MKILVTGANGQLGYDVIKALQERNIECIGTDIGEFDITNLAATAAFITSYNPDAVIHCAAYTAVDKAEDNPAECYAVNVTGTENIAKICKKIDGKMIYISTDYVFPGAGDGYYEVDDKAEPLCVYGQSKLGGEKVVRAIIDKHFIVRISWVFGKNGNNFVKTMLKLGKEQGEINVVSDQFGSPTYTADLAPLLCEMVITEKYGTYHATNEGVCSWSEFAENIFRQASYSTKVKFISSSEYPTRAVRPLNSRLSKRSLDLAGFERLARWEDAVGKYLEEIDEDIE